MNGAGMLCWFASTSGAALVAWTRAAKRGHTRPWLPPAGVLLLSLVVLIFLA